MPDETPETPEELAEWFLRDLDARIKGKNGTPPDSALRLMIMRPFIRESVRRDPEAFAEFVERYFDERPE